MKKFSYRMENILNIKLQLEEQQKIAFALANNALEEEKRELNRMAIRRRRYERHLQEILTESLDLEEIAYARKGIDYMKQLMREQTFRIASAEKKVDTERQKLNEVRMERKTQEKLKQYAFDAYKKEYAREEAREIDQSVAYNYSTKEQTI